MIDLRVLGPVRVLADDRDLDIGHARQRSLLAMLLVDVNNVVPRERLAELVWDGRPPRRARNTLAGYATRLRKVLASLPGRPVLSSQDGGYVLRVDPAAVDLCRFRDLAGRAAGVGDDEERCGLLRSALAQWSGVALSNLWGTRVESLRTTLDSERRAVLLDYFDAQLRLGRPQEILTQLQTLTEERPYDEELALRLVRAHCDSGNPAAALHAYEAARARLDRELSTRPGEALRAAGERLLHPVRPADGGTASPVTARTHEQLRMPEPTGCFVGRERELRELDALLTPGRAALTVTAAQSSNLAVISGMAGAGKTTLSLRWAQRTRDSFPDGQFFVALRGHDRHLPPLEPAETLARVLLALGLPAADIPFRLDERAALYRTLLVGRRVLIVLDDAADPEQVRHLLPPSVDGSAVVVTCRNRMPGLTATYFAGEVLLDALDDTSALALLASLVGSARVAKEPEAAAGIVRASGRLPLTVRLSGAYAASHPDEPLGEVLARVPTVDGTDARGAMGRALALSYGNWRSPNGSCSGGWVSSPASSSGGRRWRRSPTVRSPCWTTGSGRWCAPTCCPSTPRAATGCTTWSRSTPWGARPRRTPGSCAGTCCCGSWSGTAGRWSASASPTAYRWREHTGARTDRPTRGRPYGRRGGPGRRRRVPGAARTTPTWAARPASPGSTRRRRASARPSSSPRSSGSARRAGGWPTRCSASSGCIRAGTTGRRRWRRRRARPPSRATRGRTRRCC